MPRNPKPKGVEGGSQRTVYIDLAGSPTRAKVVGAGDDGIVVRAAGMEVSVAWSTLSPRRFCNIARKSSDDQETLAAYRAGHGLEGSSR